VKSAQAIALILPFLSLMAPHPAWAATVQDEVTFSTTGQALFGTQEGQAQATKTITFGNTPIFQDKRGPITAGSIVHLDQDIPVETAQAIWQKAIDVCTTQLTRTQTISITLPVFGTISRSCRGTVTPTVAQCIEGGTIMPRIVGTCCVYGGTYPNCTRGLGSDTIAVTTNQLSFNVGPGIGPKPTTGTTRPYDVGVIATTQSNVEVGVEGVVELDGGSVDVEYPTTVLLTTSADEVVPGRPFTVSATHAPRAVRLTSEYPNISLSLNTYTKADARVDVEYAGINYATGDQIRATRAVDAFNTGNDSTADSQGRIINQLISVKAGLGAGLQVKVNTDLAFGGVEGTGLAPIGPFVLPLAFPFDITNPPKPAPFCDVVPRPDCSFNPPISTDIVEMLFRTPLLDTPAVPGFNGGNDFTGVAGSDVPIEQARNQILSDGSVRNTTITGKRDALESSLEAVGGDLSKLSISDGVLDTDVVRLGVDIDGSLTGFGLPPGGADLQLPPQLPANFFIKKLAGKRLLDVEANLIDLDAVDYLYFDQEIIFQPNLKIDLVFDKPVQVRPAGAAAFTQLAATDGGEYILELPIRPDGLSTVDVIQPEGGVHITPRYSIADNRFENNLDWLINAGIQGTVGQIVLGGYVVAIVGPIITGVSDLDSLNFALGQFTPTFDQPLRFPAHEAFSLGGFGEPILGTALSVGVKPGPIGCLGDCNGNGTVAIEEILTLVNIALDRAPVGTCEDADANVDGMVTIDEILAAVHNTLAGCSSSG
jgi:hypothetical protein